MIGEKLTDVLLNTCGQLIVKLSDNDRATGQPPGHLVTYFEELKTEQKFSLRIPSKPGDTNTYLAYFMVICLDLFLRFNDGVNKSVLTGGKNMKSNSLFILNEFAELVFKKRESQSCDIMVHDEFQSIYVKFLNKLFVINFRDFYPKNSNRNRDK